MEAPFNLALGFLRSCLAVDVEHGARTSLGAVRQWLEDERGAARMRVSRIPFREMDVWRFSDDQSLCLAHQSGRFFTVEGARFHVPATGRTWEQPILNQSEVGLLGFLVAVFDGVPHFLVQAKWEPGNHALQLSPTVQATHSNYTRAHGGRAQRFLDCFVPPRAETTLFDVLMPEHGSYFRRKWNRNVAVRVPEHTPVPDGFCWVTLGQLKALLAEDDIVHMDSRSVLACLPLGAAGAGDQLVKNLGLGEHTAAIARSASVRDGIDELETWLAGTRIEVERCALDALAGWMIDEDAIRPQQAAEGFSIIAVRVEANRREVTSWTQPMIAPASEGFLGLITARESGVWWFLVEARPEPGHDGTAHVFPTVTSGVPAHQPLAAEFERAAEDEVLLAARHSEEGGRFFHCDNRYRIIEAPRGRLGAIPPTQRWLTLGQLEELARRGRVSMELRNLLAALPVSPDV